MVIDPTAPVAKVRLSSPCDLQKIRPMTKGVRDFLAAEGATDEEVSACELALVEACNNAVLYATQGGKKQTVEIEATFTPSAIELQVHDHTCGFRMPDLSNLPDEENENGRGLFIMRSLMDSVSYVRNATGNTLVLKKGRIPTVVQNRLVFRPSDDLESRLEESEQIISDMTNELSSCYEGLSAILRAGAELGKTNDLAEFSQSLGQQLLEITNSDWFVLRVVPKNESRLVLFAAYPKVTLDSLSIGIFCDSELTAEMKSAISARDVWFNARNPLDACDPLRLSMPTSFGLVHPFFFADTLMGTLTVGKVQNRPAFNAANAQVVHTFAEFLAIQIANARLREEQINHQLVSHELQIARNIQLTLLPRALPKFDRVNLSGFYESARQVGGDFYDVVSLSNHTLLLIIADVMGKGIPAAMFAAIFRSLLRSSPELNQQPGALLERVNRLLYNDLSDVDMFITAQVVFVDLEKRRFRAASAGHCPALLSSSAGEAKLIHPEGLPIGILPQANFPEMTEHFSDDARILLYTDGITETRNSSAEFFGQDRLFQWFLGKQSSTAEQLKKSLAEELKQFRGTAPLQDDQTFLLLAEEKE